MRDRSDGARGILAIGLVLGIGTLGLATAAQAGLQQYNASLILHAFANDAKGELQALPLGADCNPANGGTSCGAATLHGGAPLVGAGTTTVTGTPPYRFDLGNNRLRRTTAGSLPPYPGVAYTLTDAKMRNQAGRFRARKGPGSFTFVPALGAGSTLVRVFAGKNQFGGVMELVGKFGTRVAGSTASGGMWYGDFPTWGVSVIGAKYGKTAMVTGKLSFSSGALSYPTVGVVTGFSWTTGRVFVKAAGGYGFSTSLIRSGYDNRTSQGGGTIQLVAPRLTHWSGGSHWGDIAILKVEFVPEPRGWVMLVAGSAFLAVAYRARPRAR